MPRTMIEFAPLPETSIFRNEGGGITIQQICPLDAEQHIVLPLVMVEAFCEALREVRDANLETD